MADERTQGERLASIEAKVDNLVTWVSAVNGKMDTMIQKIPAHSVKIENIEAKQKLIDKIMVGVIIGLLTALILTGIRFMGSP